MEKVTMVYYKPTENRKQCMMTFRVTDEEKKALEGLAAAAGCSVSDLVRSWIAKAVKKMGTAKKG
jgi:predicted HicB family RNase H-like nuclease